MPEATPVLVSMMSWLCLVQSSQIQLIQRLECFLDCSPQGKILLVSQQEHMQWSFVNRRHYWNRQCPCSIQTTLPPPCLLLFLVPIPPLSTCFCFQKPEPSRSAWSSCPLGRQLKVVGVWKPSSLAQHQLWEVSYTLAGSGLSHPRGLYLKPPSCLVSCLPIPDHLPLEHPLHTSLHTNPLRDVTEDTRRKPARPGGLWAPPESKGQGSLEVISTNPRKTPRSTQAVTSPLHPGSHRPESKLALEYPAPRLWYGKGNQPGSLLEKKEGRGDKGLSGTRSFLPTPSPGLKVSLHDALRSLHSAPSPLSDRTTSGSCSGPVPWDSNKQLSRPVLDGHTMPCARTTP